MTMKVTRLGPTEPTLSLTSTLSGGGGNVGPSGQVPTSNGSNGVAWGSNVATIFANGSNLLMGPTLNLASGSNIVFTFDGISGSNPSNTLRIHSTGGGSGGGGLTETYTVTNAAVDRSYNANATSIDEIADVLGTLIADLTVGGGGSSLTVEDEGTPLATAATTLDFVGAGVTASGTGAEKTITIPGGGGGDPFDGKPYIWTPPSSANAMDDEFNDATGMSGPVNGLDAQWTKRNLGTASWFVLDDAVAPGCAYFDIPTGQASDQGIYQTVPAGDWTFAAHMHGHRSSDRQYWGVFCVSSAGTGILAVMDTGADTSNGLRTLTTWADGGAGTFHGEAAWNTDENGLNRNPSNPVTVTLRKASGVYHMGYSYSHRLLPGNYFEISHTPTAFTAAFVGVGRFGPAGTAGVSKVTIDFFRRVA